MAYVYRYKNRAGEAVYIGKTKDLVSRHYAHTRDPWFNDDLILEYIEGVTPADADILETYFISKDQPKNNKAKQWGGSCLVLSNIPDWQSPEQAIKRKYIELVLFLEELTRRLILWSEKWHGTANNFTAMSAATDTAASTAICGGTAAIRASTTRADVDSKT